MTATITRSGFLSSVQDLGRIGHRQSGVSVGGALDSHALKVANLLVGNEPTAAGIEVTLGQLRIRFDDERFVAWAGGAFQVRVSDIEIPAGRCAWIRAGEEVSVTASDKGTRVWLAISSGIDVPRVLGSRSTDLRNGFGGFSGRALRDGDVLPLGSLLPSAAGIANKIGAARMASWGAPSEWVNTTPLHPFLRVVRGGDWSRFEEAAQNSLLQESFVVARESDRMGIRLEGPVLDRLTNDDLISEAVAPGTIQVPPNGQPILLLGDCQTIGGYPKIAHVITVDLSGAAQLRPGDVVRFAETTIDEAERWLIERERDFQLFRTGLALKTS